MPAKGSGAGRIKGSPQLVIRVSPAEKAELVRRAHIAGLKLSEYVRKTALDQWRPIPLPPETPR